MGGRDGQQRRRPTNFPPMRRRRPRRTWGQRIVTVVCGATAIAAVAAAGGVWWANAQADSVQRVSIGPGGSTPATTVSPSTGAGAGVTTTTAQAFDLKAENYLLVGTDSRDCIDPSSPYAGAFLGNGDVGERSDTIMLFRVDPDESKAAILSFPRDLWVKIGDTN